MFTAMVAPFYFRCNPAFKVTKKTLMGHPFLANDATRIIANSATSPSLPVVSLTSRNILQLPPWYVPDFRGPGSRPTGHGTVLAILAFIPVSLPLHLNRELHFRT